MHRLAALAVFSALVSSPSLATVPQTDLTIIEVFREPPLFLLQVGDLAGAGVIKSMTKIQGPVPRDVSASQQLAAALKVEFESRAMSFGALPTDVLPQKRKRSLNGDTPNSLQVFTDFSGISYLPRRWHTYQYGMKGRARLIGTNGSVLWEKKCYIKHTKEDARFQIAKDGFDRDGLRIREVVQAAARECARIIAGQI